MKAKKKRKQRELTPYRRNRTLRAVEKSQARAPIAGALKILKTMIDAAIVRGEQSISADIKSFITEN